MLGETVGVVGLGMMGGRVAGYLASQGETTFGYDKLGSVSARPGVILCESVADIAVRARVLLLSLPDAKAVHSLIDELIASTERQVEVVVDLSTIGVPGAEEAANRLAHAGIEYVDSPVSGSITGAESGQLILMVGAPDSTVERVRPVLELIGRQVSHVGQRPGMGQVMKLINNAISGATLAVTNEAFIVGLDLGLDLQLMLDVINASTGRSFTTEVKFPKQVVTGAFAHGGPGSHFQKDIGLFLEIAERTGTEHRVAQAAASLWDEYSNAWPGADQTAIFRYLRGEDRE